MNRRVRLQVPSEAKPAFFADLSGTAEEVAEKLVLYADNVPQRLKPD